ncbi:MAG TPA: MCE family protein [Candidatus Dormibacteraeota bacterium]|jgi:phospholipid/cholesterol/gamma-HCH transport system substrate-binding protein|nr:MCE family protein [Candidatus Dormibacteraeota bacterium]
MRLTRGNPYLAGCGLLALVLAAIVAATSINLSFGLPFDLSPSWPPARDYTLRAVFVDANGLTKGADVMVAGVRVGQVTGVRASQGRALVTMRIGHQYAPVHRGTVASIRYSTLLAEKYVELTPAAGTAALPPGATIPSDETLTPVDFDQFLSSLDPETRQQVRVLVQQLGGGVAGRRAAVADLLDQLAGLSVESQPTLDTLARRDPQLASITADLATVSARLAQSHQQLGDLVQQTAVVTGTLVDSEAQLDSLLTHLADTTDDVDQTLNGNEGNLHATVTRLEPVLVQLNDNLETTNPYLQESQSELIAGFNYLIPYITSAISQQDANGNYLRQFVVVDLCYDTLDRKPSNPSQGCLVQAVSGAVSPASEQPRPASGGTSRPPVVCPSPSPSPRPPVVATPSPVPCPQPSPSPCGPAGRPQPSPTPTRPSPAPTACPSPGGGGPLPLPLPSPLSGILNLLLGGGS